MSKRKSCATVAGLEAKLAQALDQAHQLVELLFGVSRRQRLAQDRLADEQILGGAEVGGDAGAIDIGALSGGADVSGFLGQAIDQVFAQLQRGADDELIADLGETWAEVVADVVVVAFELVYFRGSNR